MAASSVSRNHVRDGGFWHISSFGCAAKIGRYWSNSGHCSTLALNGSVANDPERTLGPHVSDLSSSPTTFQVYPSFPVCSYARLGTGPF
jgi:hypothetical protein